MPRLSVLVCTLPRSGSWLLCEGLWQTGVAGRPEEYLRPDWFERFRSAGQLEFQHRLHQRDPWPAAKQRTDVLPFEQRDDKRFLDRIRTLGCTPNGIFGLKCHWFQASDLLQRLAGPGQDPVALHDVFPATRYVRLVRRDKGRQAISWQRAMDDNVWWSTGAQSSDMSRLTWDEARLRHHIARLEGLEEQWNRYFADPGLLDRCGPPIEVDYEDLAGNYQPTLRRVLDELGIGTENAAFPPPRLHRQADALSDNWASRLAPDAGLAPGPTRQPHRYRNEGVMRTNVIMVDNFYANPTAVRDWARKQEWYYPYEPRAEVEAGRRRPTWLTTRFRNWTECPFKSSTELMGRLELMTGDCIDVDHWTRDFPFRADGRPATGRQDEPTSCVWNCSIHVKLDSGQDHGQGVHNHVVDTWNSVGEDGWAGLLYLNEDAPVRGGLSLWRNVDPAHDWDWMTPKDQWELVDDLGNIPNRLLLCRGGIPHSGARGWGTGIDDGRLYQTFFFRVRHRPPLDGVLAPV